MTCIVAITDRRDVWMGADTASVDETGAVYIRATPKIWQQGPFVIGVAGDTGICQALRYGLRTPETLTSMAAGRYMATQFVDAVARCLQERGRLETENGLTAFDGTILVGVAGRLFMVDGVFGVTELADAFAAIGSGAPEARGALHALDAGQSYDGTGTRSVLTTALEAAERFDNSVRRPFTLVSSRSE